MASHAPDLNLLNYRLNRNLDYNYELAVETRDPAYYESIKSYVNTMPDLLAETMQTVAGRQSVQSRTWDGMTKWKAIYLDLETLDMASSRGVDGEFDVNFIETIGDIDTPSNFKSECVQLNKRTFAEHKSSLVRFFETYPYLSYVLTQMDISTNMAFCALLVGKLSWIDEGTLDLMVMMDKSQNNMLKYVPDYPTAVLLNNRYDLIRGPTLFKNNGIFNWPLFVIQLIRDLNMLNSHVVAHYIYGALENTSVEMLETMLGKRDSQFLALVKTNLLGLGDIPRWLKTVIENGNVEIVKYLLSNYSDIISPHHPPELLITVGGHAFYKSVVNWLRKFIVELQLPIHDLSYFICYLDINFVRAALKYLDAASYSSKVAAWSHTLAYTCRIHPVDTIAMLELLDEYYDIMRNSTLLQHSGGSKELLLYLHNRDPTLLIPYRESIRKRVKDRGYKDIIQTVVDIWGPY